VELRPLLELYIDRTPGALLEEKTASVAWHYRRVALRLHPGDRRRPTDEELFKRPLPEQAWTIRVGDGGASAARYSVSGPGEVRRLLRALT